MSRTTNTKAIVILGIVTLATAGVISYFAYGAPDALEHSLETHAAQGEPETGLEPAGTEPVEGEEGYAGALPDYSVPGVEKPFISGGAAGIIGVVVTFLVIVVVGQILKSRKKAKGEMKTSG